MSALGQYGLSIITAALICGILTGITPSGAGKGIIRFLCGIFLTVTMIQPLTNLDFTFDSWTFSLDAEQTAYAGEKMARDAQAAIIKAELQAYILDKAAEMNTSISVEVTVGSDQMPEEVRIKGKVSPYVRLCLEEMIESDLGITKEHQIWIG